MRNKLCLLRVGTESVNPSIYTHIQTKPIYYCQSYTIDVYNSMTRPVSYPLRSFFFVDNGKNSGTHRREYDMPIFHLFFTNYVQDVTS